MLLVAPQIISEHTQPTTVAQEFRDKVELIKKELERSEKEQERKKRKSNHY